MHAYKQTKAYFIKTTKNALIKSPQLKINYFAFNKTYLVASYIVQIDDIFGLISKVFDLDCDQRRLHEHISSLATTIKANSINLELEVKKAGMRLAQESSNYLINQNQQQLTHYCEQISQAEESKLLKYAQNKYWKLGEHCLIVLINLENDSGELQKKQEKDLSQMIIDAFNRSIIQYPMRHYQLKTGVERKNRRCDTDYINNLYKTFTTNQIYLVFCIIIILKMLIGWNDRKKSNPYYFITSLIIWNVFALILILKFIKSIHMKLVKLNTIITWNRTKLQQEMINEYDITQICAEKDNLVKQGYIMGLFAKKIFNQILIIIITPFSKIGDYKIWVSTNFFNIQFNYKIFIYIIFHSLLQQRFEFEQFLKVPYTRNWRTENMPFKIIQKPKYQQLMQLKQLEKYLNMILTFYQKLSFNPLQLLS